MSEGVRHRGLEILKMRGVEHLEKVVPFKITKKGIVIYPKKKFLS
jgi:KaiC/GvpD/RAD55 family RecA-like ATPase